MQASGFESAVKRICVTLVVLIAFAACGESDNDVGTAAEGTSDVDTITPGTFTIGTDLSFPPYAYLEDGEPAGFDPEIGRALAEEMGLEPEFVDTRFEQLIVGLKSLQFDAVISTMAISEERLLEVDFVPYSTGGVSIIVPTESDLRPVQESDLCGMKVALIKGSFYVPDLEGPVSEKCEADGKDPVTVLEYPTDPESTQALLTGRSDVAMSDSAVAKVAVDAAGGDIMISGDELLYQFVIGIAVTKENSEMVEAIQDALAGIDAAGEYQSLLDAYNLVRPDPEVVKELMGEQSGG